MDVGGRNAISEIVTKTRTYILVVLVKQFAAKGGPLPLAAARPDLDQRRLRGGRVQRRVRPAEFPNGFLMIFSILS
eukprot:16011924-Heterocapsa_arctica.AAC.1